MFGSMGMCLELYKWVAKRVSKCAVGFIYAKLARVGLVGQVQSNTPNAGLGELKIFTRSAHARPDLNIFNRKTNRKRIDMKNKQTLRPSVLVILFYS